MDTKNKCIAEIKGCGYEGLDPVWRVVVWTDHGTQAFEFVGQATQMAVEEALWVKGFAVRGRVMETGPGRATVEVADVLGKGV